VGLRGRRSRGVREPPRWPQPRRPQPSSRGNRQGYISERSQPAPAGRPRLAAALVTVAAMTEPRALITRRYSQVKGLRARGILSPATPPCEIDGCRNRSPLPGHRGRGTGYVYEHCHQHDYIRGVTCGPCNVQMTLMDARVDTCAARPRFGAYLAWWLRCPTCAAGPPAAAHLWQQTRARHLRARHGCCRSSPDSGGDPNPLQPGAPHAYWRGPARHPVTPTPLADPGTAAAHRPRPGSRCRSLSAPRWARRSPTFARVVSRAIRSKFARRTAAMRASITHARPRR
jgi:hypothetical protein